MSQKTIILFIILFGLIVVGMFMFATLRKAELSDTHPIAKYII
jgi:hypothetical protein